MLHAPLALLGALFAVTLTLHSPQGGLSAPSLGVAERAAGGVSSTQSAHPAPRQFALAD
jgi:hypothetical protein